VSGDGVKETWGGEVHSGWVQLRGNGGV